MSLVSEALKKAEREAAAREAREKGLPIPLETPLQPYRARRGQRGGRGDRRAGALVAILAGSATAIFVALFVARPDAEKKDSNKGSKEEVSAAAATVPPAVPLAPEAQAPAARPVEVTPAPATSTAPDPVVAAPSQPPPVSAHPAPTEPRTSPSAREPQTPSQPPPSVQAAPNEPRTPPSAREPKGSREYVRRVDFPDGSKLELGGIAYSESAPFAYLNGKLLKVGEGTAGYTLMRIDRDRVVVRGAAGELTLRLKPR